MDAPTFTIVIPTYNRPDALRRCVLALSSLDYPPEAFELVLVDDGSSLAARIIVEEMDLAFPVTVLRQDNAGPASARNLGASVALGRFLAFTDDDCAPEPGWLKALESNLTKRPGKLVGGLTINGLSENPFSKASQDLISFMYDYFSPNPSGGRFFASNNIAVSSDAFAELGGFDESFPLAAGEDRHFCNQWLAGGRQMSYEPNAIVRHYHDLTLATFWRQHFNYGRGAFHLRQTRSETSGSSQFEPLSFYLRLIVSPMRTNRGLAAVRGVALMVLMQIATVAGFFRGWLGRWL